MLGAYGSGKSSLLAHAAYERRDAPRRWVIVPGETAATPAALLLRILAELDRDAAERWEARLATRARGADPMLEPALVAQLLDELDERAREARDRRRRHRAGRRARPLRQRPQRGLGARRHDLGRGRPARGGATCCCARPPTRSSRRRSCSTRSTTPTRAALLEAAGRGRRATPSCAPGAGIPAQLLAPPPLAREGHVPARRSPPPPPRRRLRHPRAGLLSWLTARGSASPSDPDLLEQLGVSRQRAAKLLAELADQGVVRATEERPEGSGRPRKRYTLAA